MRALNALQARSYSGDRALNTLPARSYNTETGEKEN